MFCLVLSLTAMLFDLRTGKIPNQLVLLFGLAGLFLSYMLYGIDGLIQGIAGCFIAIFGLIVLFEFRVLGAGDIKLFGALGTVVGISVVWIIAQAFVLGAIEACIVLIYKKSKGRKLYEFTKVKFTVPIMFSVIITCVETYVNQMGC